MKAHATLSNLTRSRRAEVEPLRKLPAAEPQELQVEPTLLCPGPVSTSVRVKEALTRVDMSHRDSAFETVLASVVGQLKQLANAPDHDVLVLGGGATAATEAALSTFISPDLAERIWTATSAAASMASSLGLSPSARILSGPPCC